MLIGPQASSPFLMNLAQWGRGRFYACPSRFQLPDLRFKEPQSSPLPAVQEESLQLARAGFHDATMALDQAEVPPTLGLVDARLRNGASLLITAGPDRPYLAGWDQGRGRVLVWCSDLLGPMADDLRQNEHYGTLLADTVRGLIEARAAAGPQLRLEALESGLVVEVTGVDAPTWPLPRCTWQAAGGASGAQDMTPRRRGAFVTTIDWPSAGAPASLTVDVLGCRGAAAPPLPRAGRTADAWPELAQLAEASGGSTTGPLPVTSGRASRAVPVSLARPLALLSLLLFLLALLVRRWPARVPAAAAWLAFALLPLSLPSPLAAQEPAPQDKQAAPTTSNTDDVQARIRAELAAHGTLEALAKEWANGTLEQRTALAHAEGDLPRALELLPTDTAHAAERALLLEATGQAAKALAAVDQVLEQTDLPALARAGWTLRRAELRLTGGDRKGGEADLRAAVQLASDPTFAYRAGDLAGGYKLLELALELHVPPAEPKAAFAARLRRAHWQEEAGNVDGAAAEYRAALPLAPLKRDQRFVLARLVNLMQRANRLPELVAAWRAAPDLDVEQERALLLVLRELGRGDEVLQLLSRLADDGNAADLQQQALQVAVEAGATEAAVETAKQRLQKHPDDSRLRSALALLLTDLRRGDEAQSVLIDGLAHGSHKDLLLLVHTAMDLALEPAVRAGIERLRQSEQPTDRLDAVLLEADWLRGRKRGREATALLLKSRSQFTEPAHLVRLGEALERQGESKTAVALYRTAYEATHAEDLGMRLAWLLSTSKDKKEQDEAYALFKDVWLSAGSEARRVQVEERVLDLASRSGTLADLAIELEQALADPDADHKDQKRQALVKIYTRAKDSVGAELVLKELAKQPGREVEAWQDMARMHLENEEFRAYDRSLRHLIEIDPEHALDYRQQLAMGCLERGRPADARAVIREMLDSGKEASEVAFEFSAGVYTLAARYQDAIKVYRRSLALHPDRIETLLLLGNAMRGAGQRAQAVGMFADILLQDVPDDLFLVAADGLLNMDAEPGVLRFAERAVRRHIARDPRQGAPAPHAAGHPGDPARRAGPTPLAGRHGADRRRAARHLRARADGRRREPLRLGRLRRARPRAACSSATRCRRRCSPRSARRC